MRLAGPPKAAVRAPVGCSRRPRRARARPPGRLEEDRPPFTADFGEGDALAARGQLHDIELESQPFHVLALARSHASRGMAGAHGPSCELGD